MRSKPSRIPSAWLRCKNRSTGWTSSSSAFSRYSTLHFVPDTIGDLVFNGIASDVYRRGFANGLQGDGAYKLNDAHTLRAGFTVNGESTLNSNVSTVLPLDVGGNPVDAPFTRDRQQFEARMGRRRLRPGRMADHRQAHGECRPALRPDVAIRRRQPAQSALQCGLQAARGTTFHAGYARYFTPPPQAIAAPANIAPFANTSAQPDTFQQNPVLPERSHYFDAGIVQKITPNLQVGIDAYYKISKDLLDDGQFGQALILSGFNYEKAYNSGVELSANYKNGNFSAYGNLAWARQVATNVVSNQYLFGADELAYIATNYINTDHAQTMDRLGRRILPLARHPVQREHGLWQRPAQRVCQHRPCRALCHGQYRDLARVQGARRTSRSRSASTS